MQLSMLDVETVIRERERELRAIERVKQLETTRFDGVAAASVRPWTYVRERIFGESRAGRGRRRAEATA